MVVHSVSASSLLHQTGGSLRAGVVRGGTNGDSAGELPEGRVRVSLKESK